MVDLLPSDAPDLASFFQTPQWGIFDQDGQPVIIGDTVRTFHITAESRVSKYPIENGSFQSYNKVEVPFEPKIVFTKSGSTSDRTAFLDAITAAKQSLYLYWVVTPEVTYKNVNVTHYDYDRERQDAKMITVSVWLEEIRQAPPPAFSYVAPPSANVTAPVAPNNVSQVEPPTPGPGSTVASPDAANPINGGTVQSFLPTTEEMDDVARSLSAGAAAGG